MKTSLRLLAMLITAAVLFALSWYFFGRERPQEVAPPGDHSPEKQTPEASKLLIGTWKLIQMSGRKIPEHWQITVEFTVDGKHIVREFYPDQTPEKMKSELIGNYKLSGTTIIISRPNANTERERRGEVQIESISEDELWLASGWEDERQRDQFRKVR